MAIHVQSHGSGSRRIIGFHGWGGDHREFAAIARYVPPEVRLDCVDLPGYGASPEPAQWHLPSIVDEVAERLAPLDGAELVGYCSGAAIAFMLVRRHPQAIRRLVLIDPFAYVPWYFRIFLAGPLGRRAYETAFARPGGRSAVNRVLRLRHSPDDDFTGAFARMNHHAVLEYLRMFRALSLSEFAGLNLPIVLIYGEKTFAAVRDSIRQYQRLWPQARAMELKNAGHLPMMRNAREISEILFQP